MNKAELRQAVEAHLGLPDKDSDIFTAFNKILANINQNKESVIDDNFNFIIDHKKELLEILILNDKSGSRIKKLLTYPPSIMKLFIRITTYLEVPTDIILNSFSDDWLVNYMAKIKIFNKIFFDRLVKAFGKENLKQYLCYENTSDRELLRIVMEENTNEAVETNFIASKFTHICDICDVKTTESYEKIFTFLENNLQSTTSLTEKISLLEEYSKNFLIKNQIAESLQVDPLNIFTLSSETRQVFKKMCDAVDLIYMNDNIPLYKKETPNINKGRLINGLDMIYETEGARDTFHNFIVEHSTSNTVQSLVKNINSYISLYQNIAEKVDSFDENITCDYLLNLSMTTNTINTTIQIEYIKIKNRLRADDIQNIPKIWKILKIYEVLHNQYERNSGDQELAKKLRKHITFYKNVIQTNEFSEILNSFFNVINSHSHEDIISGFIKTDALLDSIPKKIRLYKILNGFKGRDKTLIHIFNTCIENKSIEILENIDSKASNKDKNEIRQYLYHEYLSDISSENQLFFEYIKNFITDDLTHTITLYSALPILKKYIEKHPEEQKNITQLRHQVSKRSIEEQNAFCYTITLLEHKGMIDIFLELCKNLGNHQKRKSIISFYKTLDIYYKIGGSESIDIKNELLIGIQKKEFPSIYLEELFESIAKRINIPVNILVDITHNNILTKFIGKVLSSDNTLQNKKLGLLISEYSKDGCNSIRSNFYSSELPELFQLGEANNDNNIEESISQIFSIEGVDQNIRPYLQYETSYMKHINGINHKEQRHNIHNAFDELFDPDIYQDNYKSFMEKLYHQKKKALIVDILQKSYPDNKTLQNLNFLLSHVKEIDTCLSSVKDDENDGQVYDNNIKKAQTLYQKIYKDILQTGNEQLAIRCEEYSSHLGLILHDGDIAREESLRESMNLETNLTYDIVKTLSHMRGCIGLHNSPVSNLNYILPNRFFLYSQNQESEKGVSDQIIVVLSSPIIGPVYVMDTLYGTRNLSVIMNHIHTLYNHITSHKQYINTPLFIPPNVISSAGMNLGTLLGELQKYFPEESIKTVTDLEVDTTRAGYKEFTTSGEGILIYTS